MNASQEPPIAPFFRLFLPLAFKDRGESSAQHLSAGFQSQERRGHARHRKAQPARELNRGNRTDGLHPAPHDGADCLILLWELVIGGEHGLRIWHSFRGDPDGHYTPNGGFRNA